jgi:hypothetical protein
MKTMDAITKTMDRRSFLRLSSLATTGLALWLVGCSVAPTDGTVTTLLEEPEVAAAVVATPTQVPAAAVATPTQMPAAVVVTPTQAPAQSQTGVSCPFGLLNDRYPGRCKHYIDRNGNSICDRSEPGSGDRTPVSAG